MIVHAIAGRTKKRSVEMPMTRYEAILVHVLAAMIVLPLFGFTGVYVWQAQPPVVWDSGEIVPQVAPPGGMVMVMRRFDVTRDADVTIDRKFIQYGRDGTITVVSMPQVVHAYKAGKFQQQRPLQIPYGMADGEWFLTNTVRWRRLIVPDGIVQSPPLRVFVRSE